MEIFGTIAKLNDKLLLIQEYFSSRKLISEPLVDHRAIQWRQNWVLAARERFNTRQALDQYSAGNILLSSVEVLENEVLHHFDACIAVRVRLSDCINELELKPCFEKIINVEIEQMIDYIDIEKVYSIIYLCGLGHLTRILCRMDLIRYEMNTCLNIMILLWLGELCTI